MNSKTYKDLPEDDPNKEWEVEKILKERSKLKKNKKTGTMQSIKEYLIKWVGYKSPTWEPEENLENCQELLKDFLIGKLLQKYQNENKKKKNFSKKELSHFEDYPNIPDFKKEKNIKQSYNLNSEEQSTINNSINNNSISNKKCIFKKMNNSKLSVLEEENMFFDIEIDEESKEKDKKEIKEQNEEQESPKIIERELFENSIGNQNEKKNKERRNNERFKIKELNTITTTDSFKLNSILNRIIPNEDDQISLEQMSHSIFLDEEKVSNYPKYKKNDKEKDKNSINFLEKKRKNPYIDIIEDKNDERGNENKIQIMEIYSMKVPENYEKEGKGIILNIKYKKYNKIFIEEFDSKRDEIPSDYLAKYYEMFICESFKGKKISKDMAFD